MPPSIPGVYMLMAFASKTGKYGSLYCGQTNDLQVRLMQHHSSATTANGFKTLRTQITPYFTAAPVLTPQERLAIEAGLIALLRPPLNRQLPRHAPLFPTLPYWALLD